MSIITNRNTFASNATENSYDLQRADLFRVNILLPAVLGLDWDSDVSFAVEKFPFPARAIDEITIKYLNQTNKMPGADTATGDTEMTLRYAFSQRTALALELWFRLISNPMTGGVGLPSQIKTIGTITHLVPSMSSQVANLGAPTPVDNSSSLGIGLQWRMEGIWPKAFKMSDLDITSTNGLTTCMVTWAIDRYYPVDVNQMVINPYQ